MQILIWFPNEDLKSLNPEVCFLYVEVCSLYVFSTFATDCMLKDLFPALYSGCICLPRVPVGNVNVKGRNTVM